MIYYLPAAAQLPRMAIPAHESAYRRVQAQHNHQRWCLRSLVRESSACTVSVCGMAASRMRSPNTLSLVGGRGAAEKRRL